MLSLLASRSFPLPPPLARCAARCVSMKRPLPLVYSYLPPLLRSFPEKCNNPADFARLRQVFANFPPGDVDDATGAGRTLSFVGWLSLHFDTATLPPPPEPPGELDFGPLLGPWAAEREVVKSLDLLYLRSYVELGEAVAEGGFAMRDDDDDVEHRGLLEHYRSLHRFARLKQSPVRPLPPGSGKGEVELHNAMLEGMNNTDNMK